MNVLLRRRQASRAASSQRLSSGTCISSNKCPFKAKIERDSVFLLIVLHFKIIYKNQCVLSEKKFHLKKIATKHTYQKLLNILYRVFLVELFFSFFFSECTNCI